MIASLPIWIELTFILVVIVTTVLFYYSNGKPKRITGIIILWCLLHSILAYFNFYQVVGKPPRFALIMIPLILFFIYAMRSKQINWALKNRDLKISTFLHSIRIIVEIILSLLFAYKMVPEMMTYHGWNFDIIPGLTAPLVGLLFLKGKITNNILLLWNVFGLCLILFILAVGTLSAELPVQLLSFNQPNRAVTFFPFVLLPAVVVPIVIYTHLIDIIKLRRERS